MPISDTTPTSPSAPSPSSVTARNPLPDAELSFKAEAKEIANLAKQADGLAIDAAKRLVALKHRIIHGELGPDIKWMEWLRINVKLSSSRLSSTGKTYRLFFEYGPGDLNCAGSLGRQRLILALSWFSPQRGWK